MTHPSNTRRLVDTQLLPLLDAWPKIDLHEGLLADLRTADRLPMPEPSEAAQAVVLERHAASGPDGDVGLLVYRPAAATTPVACIFHIHGGGYVIGAVDAQEAQHREMVAGLNCVLVTVDYRLAPETVFPGAIEDCYAGLAWVFAHAEALQIDLRRIGVMGESAGGGLAASLALLARDRGQYALAFQHLIYPMIDDRTCVRADPHPHAGEFIWTPHNNRFGWTALLGQATGGEGISPYAAAARADDLIGLPPAFIATGALDLFLEEDIEYARRLLRAGVPTELHVYPGGFHGFDFDPTAEISANARRDSLGALSRFLKGA
ncbi:alpha/beta hydrolase [Brevundimonas sp.]|uniref:alpha/beta hydrolase n=1 Tax=Brevundimonas sp. TaxID=1871086 RepID=UPI003D108E88